MIKGIARQQRVGLMVSVLNSGSSGLGSSPGRSHCVVFLDKTLHSHSASLHPGVQMGTCFMLTETGDKRWPMGHLGLYKGFTF